jgi:hypothetical protein
MLPGYLRIRNVQFVVAFSSDVLDNERNMKRRHDNDWGI